MECAEVSVPLDHADPGGEKIEISVSRIPAADRANRLGSLVVIPGGPGGGRDLTVPFALAHPRLVERYDWIAYDPRGVGESEPITCRDEAGDAVARLNPPRTPADWAAADTRITRFAEACRAGAGRMASLAGAANAARDLDVLRTALGDAKLNTVATSYGGQVAVTYAQLFPASVGRMVLNSPGNPTKTHRQVLLDQAAGLERSLASLADFCLTQDRCRLGTDRAAALRSIDELLRRLESAPAGPLTRGLAELAITTALPAPPTWPALLDGLGAALTGDGTMLAAQAEALLAGAGNFLAANSVINCTDTPDRHRLADVETAAKEFAAVSPRFGVRVATRLLECSRWPPGTGRVAITGTPGVPPVLVLGNTGDPEAPLHSVTQVAGLLLSARLLVNHADGHGAYGEGFGCVDAHTDRYLLDGTPPPSGTTCP
ncbi:alpha/beta hydrolase [Amycolatopsis suaedae]|nr:alpha/beta hydrolase [Amycolatopsis suaedae]